MNPLEYCLYSIPCNFPGNYKFTKTKLFNVAEQFQKRAADGFQCLSKALPYPVINFLLNSLRVLLILKNAY